jgi:hypothetical protein
VSPADTRSLLLAESMNNAFSSISFRTFLHLISLLISLKFILVGCHRPCYISSPSVKHLRTLQFSQVRILCTEGLRLMHSTTTPGGTKLSSLRPISIQRVLHTEHLLFPFCIPLSFRLLRRFFSMFLSFLRVVFSISFLFITFTFYIFSSLLI